MADDRTGGACRRTYSSPNGLSKRTWAVVPRGSRTPLLISRVRSAWKFLVAMDPTWPTTSGPIRTWALVGRLRTLANTARTGYVGVLMPSNLGRDWRLRAQPLRATATAPTTIGSANCAARERIVMI